jgi:hypothetical protein
MAQQFSFSIARRVLQLNKNNLADFKMFTALLGTGFKFVHCTFANYSTRNKKLKLELCALLAVVFLFSN